MSWARANVKLAQACLAQATKFTAIRHFRTALRRDAFFSAITEEQYSASAKQPGQILSDHEDLQRLEKVILALPARTRQVFLLNRIHGCSYAEIAVGLAISSSTVKREMAKAVDRNPYNVVELFGSYGIRDTMTFNVAVDNVADRYYMDALTFGIMPSPGRSARVSVSAKL